jgi:hypothetical protein
MTVKNPPNDDEHLSDLHSRDVLFFSTPKRMVAVSSPVKVIILNLVKRGPVPLETIVKRTGKANSTITTHIRDLEEAGLIRSHPDPHDLRRRIIVTASNEIGRLTTEGRDIQSYRPEQNDMTKFFTRDDAIFFFRLFLNIFRNEAMSLRINIDPVQRQTGIKIGELLAPMVGDKTIEGVVRNLDDFWQAYDLGRITLHETSPLSIKVRDCFECRSPPITGHKACYFQTVLFTSVFSNHLNYPVSVVETGAMQMDTIDLFS